MRSQPNSLIAASVTIPAGLVKLINQAFGHCCRISSIIEPITGIVRIALSIPPAPFVSCPKIPCDNGIRSSFTRASSSPTRNCVVTKSASFKALKRSKVNVTFQSNPAALIIRLAISPTIFSFSCPASISTSTISSIGNSSFRLI